jgi:hypothetical protein
MSRVMAIRRTDTSQAAATDLILRPSRDMVQIAVRRRIASSAESAGTDPPHSAMYSSRDAQSGTSERRDKKRV